MADDQGGILEQLGIVPSGGIEPDQITGVDSVKEATGPPTIDKLFTDVGLVDLPEEEETSITPETPGRPEDSALKYRVDPVTGQALFGVPGETNKPFSVTDLLPEGKAGNYRRVFSLGNIFAYPLHALGWIGDMSGLNAISEFGHGTGQAITDVVIDGVVNGIGNTAGSLEGLGRLMKETYDISGLPGGDSDFAGTEFMHQESQEVIARFAEWIKTDQYPDQDNEKYNEWKESSKFTDKLKMLSTAPFWYNDLKQGVGTSVAFILPAMLTAGAGVGSSVIRGGATLLGRAGNMSKVMAGARAAKVVDGLSFGADHMLGGAVQAAMESSMEANEASDNYLLEEYSKATGTQMDIFEFRKSHKNQMKNNPRFAGIVEKANNLSAGTFEGNFYPLFVMNTMQLSLLTAPFRASGLRFGAAKAVRNASKLGRSVTGGRVLLNSGGEFFQEGFQTNVGAHNRKKFVSFEYGAAGADFNIWEDFALTAEMTEEGLRNDPETQLNSVIGFISGGMQQGGMEAVSRYLGRNKAKRKAEKIIENTSSTQAKDINRFMEVNPETGEIDINPESVAKSAKKMHSLTTRVAELNEAYETNDPDYLDYLHNENIAEMVYYARTNGMGESDVINAVNILLDETSAGKERSYVNSDGSSMDSEQFRAKKILSVMHASNSFERASVFSTSHNLDNNQRKLLFDSYSSLSHFDRSIDSYTNRRDELKDKASEKELDALERIELEEIESKLPELTSLKNKFNQQIDSVLSTDNLSKYQKNRAVGDILSRADSKADIQSIADDMELDSDIKEAAVKEAGEQYDLREESIELEGTRRLYSDLNNTRTADEIAAVTDKHLRNGLDNAVEIAQNWYGEKLSALRNNATKFDSSNPENSLKDRWKGKNKLLRNTEIKDIEQTYRNMFRDNMKELTEQEEERGEQILLDIREQKEVSGKSPDLNSLSGEDKAILEKIPQPIQDAILDGTVDTIEDFFKVNSQAEFTTKYRKDKLFKAITDRYFREVSDQGTTDNSYDYETGRPDNTPSTTAVVSYEGTDDVPTRTDPNPPPISSIGEATDVQEESETTTAPTNTFTPPTQPVDEEVIEFDEEGNQIEEEYDNEYYDEDYELTRKTDEASAELDKKEKSIQSELKKLLDRLNGIHKNSINAKLVSEESQREFNKRFKNKLDKLISELYLVDISIGIEEEVQHLASRLSPLVGSTPDSARAIAIVRALTENTSNRIIISNTWSPDSRSGERYTPGEYDTREGITRIYLKDVAAAAVLAEMGPSAVDMSTDYYPGYLSLGNPTEMLTYVLGHELVHAYTADRVRIFDILNDTNIPDNIKGKLTSTLTSEEIEALTELDNLWDTLTNKHPELANAYGMTNRYELLSEGLTNPTFRKALADIQITKKLTFLDKLRGILNKILRLFRLKTLSVTENDTYADSIDNILSTLWQTYDPNKSYDSPLMDEPIKHKMTYKSLVSAHRIDSVDISRVRRDRKVNSLVRNIGKVLYNTGDLYNDVQIKELIRAIKPLSPKLASVLGSIKSPRSKQLITETLVEAYIVEQNLYYKIVRDMLAIDKGGPVTAKYIRIRQRHPMRVQFLTEMYNQVKDGRMDLEDLYIGVRGGMIDSLLQTVVGIPKIIPAPYLDATKSTERRSRLSGEEVEKIKPGFWSVKLAIRKPGNLKRSLDAHLLLRLQRLLYKGSIDQYVLGKVMSSLGEFYIELEKRLKKDPSIKDLSSQELWTQVIKPILTTDIIGEVVVSQVDPRLFVYVRGQESGSASIERVNIQRQIERLQRELNKLQEDRITLFEGAIKEQKALRKKYKKEPRNQREDQQVDLDNTAVLNDDIIQEGRILTDQFTIEQENNFIEEVLARRNGITIGSWLKGNLAVSTRPSHPETGSFIYRMQFEGSVAELYGEINGQFFRTTLDTANNISILELSDARNGTYSNTGVDELLADYQNNAQVFITSLFPEAGNVISSVNSSLGTAPEISKQAMWDEARTTFGVEGFNRFASAVRSVAQDYLDNDIEGKPDFKINTAVFKYFLEDLANTIESDKDTHEKVLSILTNSLVEQGYPKIDFSPLAKSTGETFITFISPITNKPVVLEVNLDILSAPGRPSVTGTQEYQLSRDINYNITGRTGAVPIDNRIKRNKKTAEQNTPDKINALTGISQHKYTPKMIVPNPNWEKENYPHYLRGSYDSSAGVTSPTTEEVTNWKRAIKFILSGKMQESSTDTKGTVLYHEIDRKVNAEMLAQNPDKDAFENNFIIQQVVYTDAELNAVPRDSEYVHRLVVGSVRQYDPFSSKLSESTNKQLRKLREDIYESYLELRRADPESNIVFAPAHLNGEVTKVKNGRFDNRVTPEGKRDRRSLREVNNLPTSGKFSLGVSIGSDNAYTILTKTEGKSQSDAFMEDWDGVSLDAVHSAGFVFMGVTGANGKTYPYRLQTRKVGDIREYRNIIISLLRTSRPHSGSKNFWKDNMYNLQTYVAWVDPELRESYSQVVSPDFMFDHIAQQNIGDSHNNPNNEPRFIKFLTPDINSRYLSLMQDDNTWAADAIYTHNKDGLNSIRNLTAEQLYELLDIDSRPAQVSVDHINSFQDEYINPVTGKVYGNYHQFLLENDVLVTDMIDYEAAFHSPSYSYEVTEVETKSEPHKGSANYTKMVGDMLDNSDIYEISSNSDTIQQDSTGPKYKVIRVLSDPNRKKDKSPIVMKTLRAHDKMNDTVKAVIYDYFKDNPSGTYSSAITPRAVVHIREDMYAYKRELFKKGHTIEAVGVIIVNEEMGIANKIDLLTRDPQGKLHMHQFKTSRGNPLSAHSITTDGEIQKKVSPDGLGTVAYYSTYEGTEVPRATRHANELRLTNIAMYNKYGVGAVSLSVGIIDLGKYTLHDENAQAEQAILVRSIIKIPPSREALGHTIRVKHGDETTRNSTATEQPRSTETPVEPAPPTDTQSDSYTKDDTKEDTLEDEDDYFDDGRFKLGLSEKDLDEVPGLTREKAIQWFKERFGEVAIEMDNELIGKLYDIYNTGGSNIYGLFWGGMVKLSHRATSKTVRHESFHVVFNLFATLEQRTSLLKEARSRYNKPTQADLNRIKNLVPTGTDLNAIENIYYEEQLADEFENLKQNQGVAPSTLTGKIREFIMKLWNMIFKKNALIARQYITDRTNIEQMFEMIDLNALGRDFVGRRRKSYSDLIKRNLSELKPSNIRFSTAGSWNTTGLRKRLGYINRDVINDIYGNRIFGKDFTKYNLKYGKVPFADRLINNNKPGYEHGLTASQIYTDVQTYLQDRIDNSTGPNDHKLHKGLLEALVDDNGIFYRHLIYDLENLLNIRISTANVFIPTEVNEFGEAFNGEFAEETAQEFDELYDNEDAEEGSGVQGFVDPDDAKVNPDKKLSTRIKQVLNFIPVRKKDKDGMWKQSPLMIDGIEVGLEYYGWNDLFEQLKVLLHGSVDPMHMLNKLEKARVNQPWINDLFKAMEESSLTDKSIETSLVYTDLWQTIGSFTSLDYQAQIHTTKQVYNEQDNETSTRNTIQHGVSNMQNPKQYLPRMWARNFANGPMWSDSVQVGSKLLTDPTTLKSMLDDAIQLHKDINKIGRNKGSVDHQLSKDLYEGLKTLGIVIDIQVWEELIEIGALNEFDKILPPANVLSKIAFNYKTLLSALSKSNPADFNTGKNYTALTKIAELLSYSVHNVVKNTFINMDGTSQSSTTQYSYVTNLLNRIKSNYTLDLISGKMDVKGADFITKRMEYAGHHKAPIWKMLLNSENIRNNLSLSPMDGMKTPNDTGVRYKDMTSTQIHAFYLNDFIERLYPSNKDKRKGMRYGRFMLPIPTDSTILQGLKLPILEFTKNTTENKAFDIWENIFNVYEMEVDMIMKFAKQPVPIEVFDKKMVGFAFFSYLNNPDGSAKLEYLPRVQRKNEPEAEYNLYIADHKKIILGKLKSEFGKIAGQSRGIEENSPVAKRNGKVEKFYSRLATNGLFIKNNNNKVDRYRPNKRTGLLDSRFNRTKMTEGKGEKPNEKTRSTILELYYLNTWFWNTQIIMITEGHPAFYKSYNTQKKRSKAVSTGGTGITVYSTDRPSKQMIVQDDFQQVSESLIQTVTDILNRDGVGKEAKASILKALKGEQGKLGHNTSDGATILSAREKFKRMHNAGALERSPSSRKLQERIMSGIQDGADSRMILAPDKTHGYTQAPMGDFLSPKMHKHAEFTLIPSVAYKLREYTKDKNGNVTTWDSSAGGQQRTYITGYVSLPTVEDRKNNYARYANPQLATMYDFMERDSYLEQDIPGIHKELDRLADEKGLKGVRRKAFKKQKLDDKISSRRISSIPFKSVVKVGAPSIIPRIEDLSTMTVTNNPNDIVSKRYARWEIESEDAYFNDIGSNTTVVDKSSPLSNSFKLKNSLDFKYTDAKGDVKTHTYVSVSTLISGMKKLSHEAWASYLGMKEVMPKYWKWEDVQVDVMKQAISQKFKKNPELTKALMATQPKIMSVESSSLWGINKKTGIGSNGTGKILTEQRDAMRLIGKGAIGLTTVVDYTTYKVQQPINGGKYLDSTGTLGSQAEKHIVSNLDFESGYAANKGMAEFRGSTNDVLGVELFTMFGQLISRHISEANDNFQEMLNDIEETRKLLISKINRENLSFFDHQALEAPEDSENGPFLFPLWLGVHTNKIQSMMMSVFRERVLRQKVNGGQYINAPSTGRANSVVINRTKENPAGEKVTLEVHFHKNGGIKYFDAIMPRFSKKLFEPYINKQTGEVDVASMPDQIRQGFEIEIDKLPEESRKGFVYRIPTESKYSMIPIRVKAWSDSAEGGIIILPELFTTLTGADFDIDKMFSIFYNTELIDGELTVVKSSMDTKKGRENLLLDIMFTVWGSSKTTLEALSTQDTQTFHSIANEMGYSMENDSQSDLADPYDQVSYADRFRVFAKLIGIFALDVSFHAKYRAAINGLEMVDTRPNPKGKPHPPVGMRFTEYYNDIEGVPEPTAIKDFNRVFELTKQGREPSIQTIVHNGGTYLASSVDGAADPVLTLFNITEGTASYVAFMTALGYPKEVSAAFMGQPIIQRLVAQAQIDQLDNKPFGYTLNNFAIYSSSKIHRFIARMYGSELMGEKPALEKAAQQGVKLTQGWNNHIIDSEDMLNSDLIRDAKDGIYMSNVYGRKPSEEQGLTKYTDTDKDKIGKRKLALAKALARQLIIIQNIKYMNPFVQERSALIQATRITTGRIGKSFGHAVSQLRGIQDVHMMRNPRILNKSSVLPQIAYDAIQQRWIIEQNTTEFPDVNTAVRSLVDLVNTAGDNYLPITSPGFITVLHTIEANKGYNSTRIMSGEETNQIFDEFMNYAMSNDPYYKDLNRPKFIDDFFFDFRDYLDNLRLDSVGDNTYTDFINAFEFIEQGNRLSTTSESISPVNVVRVSKGFQTKEQLDRIKSQFLERFEDGTIEERELLVKFMHYVVMTTGLNFTQYSISHLIPPSIVRDALPSFFKRAEDYARSLSNIDGYIIGRDILKNNFKNPTKVQQISLVDFDGDELDGRYDNIIWMNNEAVTQLDDTEVDRLNYPAGFNGTIFKNKLVSQTEQGEKIYVQFVTIQDVDETTGEAIHYLMSNISGTSFYVLDEELGNFPYYKEYYPDTVNGGTTQFRDTILKRLSVDSIRRITDELNEKQKAAETAKNNRIQEEQEQDNEESEAKQTLYQFNDWISSQTDMPQDFKDSIMSHTVQSGLYSDILTKGTTLEDLISRIKSSMC